MKYLVLIIFLFLSVISFAQQNIICDKTSHDLFLEKIEKFYSCQYDTLPNAARITAIAKSFLKTTYVAKTLEVQPKKEVLTVNLSGIDCTTFLEYVIAINRMLQANDKSFERFTEVLQQIRYRSGEMNGYTSRLHYFSEWLQDNQQKNILKIVSRELGGEAMNKPLNFMSTHPDSYEQLKSSKENIAKLKEIESKISPQNINYIPQENIPAIEDKVIDGDLIAITTNLKGLDVVHVGFAYKQNNRLHLLHASTGTMNVVISDIPLAEMISKNKIQNGIIVSRLN